LQRHRQKHRLTAVFLSKSSSMGVTTHDLIAGTFR
jgi:hypothetical protein